MLAWLGTNAAPTGRRDRVVAWAGVDVDRLCVSDMTSDDSFETSPKEFLAAGTVCCAGAATTINCVVQRRSKTCGVARRGLRPCAERAVGGATGRERERERGEGTVMG